jgi:hypothetical protein
MVFADDGSLRTPEAADTVRNDFTDEPPSRHDLLQDLKSVYNQTVRDEGNAVDRVVFTDTLAAPQLSSGAIWMASDMTRKGREIGDWLVRRIVTDFHEMNRAEPLYWFPDAETKRSYRISFKNVETDKGKDTQFCVLVISVDDDQYLQGNATVMAHKTRDYLRAIRAIF